MYSMIVRYDAVALNPQPLPPRWSARFDWVLLNPQPLPPRYMSKVIRY